MNILLIGIVANLLNTLSLIPSIKHVYMKNDLTSYPINFLTIMIIANFLWIVYGYGVKAYQTMIMGVIFASYYALFLYWKLMYGW